MTIQEQIDYWIKLSDEDLSTAEILLSNKKYVICLYMCHLMIEKILKAHYLKNNLKNPPKTHDLVYLSSKSGIQFNNEQIDFLDRLNFFQIEARYPDYKMEIYKTCSKDFTNSFFYESKEFFKWIKSKI